jgi:hypothetical protein
MTPKPRKRQPVTQAQLDRLQEMLNKKYPITSLRYNYLDGYLSVGVTLEGGNAAKFIAVGPNGELKG